MWFHNVLTHLAYPEVSRLRLVSRLFYYTVDGARKSPFFWQQYLQGRGLPLNKLTPYLDTPAKWELLEALRTFIVEKTITATLIHGLEKQNLDLVGAYLSKHSILDLDDVVGTLMLMLGYQPRDKEFRSRIETVVAERKVPLSRFKIERHLSAPRDIAAYNLLIDLRQAGEIVILRKDIISYPLLVFNIATDNPQLTPVEFISMQDLTGSLTYRGGNIQLELLTKTVRTPVNAILTYLRAINDIQDVRVLAAYVRRIYDTHYNPTRRIGDREVTLRVVDVLKGLFEFFEKLKKADKHIAPEAIARALEEIVLLITYIPYARREVLSDPQSEPIADDPDIIAAEGALIELVNDYDLQL